MPQLLQTFRPNLDGDLYGAQRVPLNEFILTIFINRVTNKADINKYSEEYGLPSKAPAKHVIKKFGLKFVADFESLKLFRNEDFPLVEGSQRWCFNILKPTGKTSILYALSVEITKAQGPNPVEFKAHHRIEAALAVYREACARAELELRYELERICSNSINEATPKTKIDSFISKSKAETDEKPAKTRLLKKKRAT